MGAWPAPDPEWQATAIAGLLAIADDISDGTREMVVRPACIMVHAESPDVVTVLRILHAAQQWP